MMMLWHLPPPVLQEWIQKIPTPSGRSGSHSTQNNPNFPQGLLPWWHWWGKWGRRKLFSVRMAVNFLINISEEANIGSNSEKLSLSISLWAKVFQGKAILVYSDLLQVVFFKIEVLCWGSLEALEYDSRKRETGWVHPFTHSSSRALALSYLEPKLTDIGHPTIPMMGPPGKWADYRSTGK